MNNVRAVVHFILIPPEKTIVSVTVWFNLQRLSNVILINYLCKQPTNSGCLFICTSDIVQIFFICFLFFLSLFPILLIIYFSLFKWTYVVVHWRVQGFLHLSITSLVAPAYINLYNLYTNTRKRKKKRKKE